MPADQQQQPALRITPGGFISAMAPHLIGDRGAAPFTTSPGTFEGFKNLVSLNGKVAWPILNGSTDAKPLSPRATFFLGGNTKGSGNNFDMVAALNPSWIFNVPYDTGTAEHLVNANGEISFDSTTGSNYGARVEPFTVAGTVTVTAGAASIVGAGTNFTAADLTGGYGLTAAQTSFRHPRVGDIIGIGTAPNIVWFRIQSITDATHMTIFPTPTAGNPAIGAGKTYTIVRSGYGSHSRMVILGSNGYYIGGNFTTSSGVLPGTIMGVSLAGGGQHYTGPKTVDTAGNPVADLNAVDLVYWKNYLLYGFAGGIGWSVAGAPTTFPFGVTDFPAGQISEFAANDEFVSFEFLGDQLIAFFENSVWMIQATGSVPEFQFYRLPEAIGIQNAAAVEPCGINSALVWGRPSCSGRGAAFYVSNRGIEALPGTLADEISEPIANGLDVVLGGGQNQPNPLFLSWDDGFDLLWIRKALGSAPSGLIYNPETKDWSSYELQNVTGQGICSITGGVQPYTRVNDRPRIMHLSYYEILDNSGTPGTNGGGTRFLTGGFELNVQGTGLVGWVWDTPVIPLGLSYPGFSFGGFLLDAMTTTSGTPVPITWTLYGGSSPYNMVQRDTGTIVWSTGPVRKATWTSTRDLIGQKDDEAFVQLRFGSTVWVALEGVVLLDSRFQVRR